MNERHFAEIEKTLLFVSEARKRAAHAAKDLRSSCADEHLVAALEDAERELEVLGRRLMQNTYFAVEREQLSFEAAGEQLTVS
jgi:hypothetical protein